MSKRIKWSGTAQGRKVDEDKPVALLDGGQTFSTEDVHHVMVAVKVSEEDAKYLLREKHWDSAMYAMRRRVDSYNRGKERLVEDNDG